MQALRIRLQGRYWDSTLYNDRLLLVGQDGTLQAYRWDRLVRYLLPADELARVAMTHLATRARAWYGLAMKDLIGAAPARQLMLDAVTALTGRSFEVDREALLSHLDFEVGVGMFPSTDLEIYANRLYLGSTDGLVSAPLSDLDSDSLDPDALIFDGPCLRLDASYHRLGVAMGESGLATLDIPQRYWDLFDVDLVSEEASFGCAWVSFDLVASQPGNGGYVAAFANPRWSAEEDDDLVDEPVAEFLGRVRSDDLFDRSGGLLFGNGNVLALALPGQLLDEQWNPYRRRKGYGVDISSSTARSAQATIEKRLTEDPLDARVTVFGVVLELDDRLLIRGSDGRQRTIPGEPVRWRVFPRSARYANHLHVVFEDHVDIYAFAHDYFVPEKDRSLALRRPSATSW